MNVILRKDTTKNDLAQFHHGALFSPVTSTMPEAIKNSLLITWPVLSDELMTKNLPPSLMIAKGRQNQKRQGNSINCEYISITHTGVNYKLVFLSNIITVKSLTVILTHVNI